MEFPLTIKNQQELDDLFKDRLKRARQTWEADAGISEYRQQAQEAERRAQEAEANAYGRLVQRDARSVLAGYGVTDRGRQDLILRLVDLNSVPETDGDPDQSIIQRKLKDLHKATPEVFGPDATVEERGLDTSTRDGGQQGGTGEPISRERLEAMSPEQINSNWDRVKAFLAGERG